MWVYEPDDETEFYFAPFVWEISMRARSPSLETITLATTWRFRRAQMEPEIICLPLRQENSTKVTLRYRRRQHYSNSPTASWSEFAKQPSTVRKFFHPFAALQPETHRCYSVGLSIYIPIRQTNHLQQISVRSTTDLIPLTSYIQPDPHKHHTNIDQQPFTSIAT